MGLTRGQMLRQVQLPMARRTIVVGINQCMMAALSMATIAALVNGPGLGKPVVSGPADPERRRRIGGRPGHRGDGDHARPHHDCGQRAVRRPHGRRIGERPGSDVHRCHARAAAPMGDRGRRQGSAPAAADQGRPLAAHGATARACGLLRLAVPVQAELRGVPGRQRDAGPQVHQRHRADPLHQRVHRLVRGLGGHLHHLAQGQHHRVVHQPAPGPDGRLALVGDGARAARRRLRPRRLAPGRDHAGLRGDHLLDRPVERHHDHPRDDAHRDRPGDADRRRPRCGHGPQPKGRPGDQAVPRRVPDDPAVRLPGAGAGALHGQPVHRDRRRPSRTPSRSPPSWSPTGSGASPPRPSRRRGPAAAPPGR